MSGRNGRGSVKLLREDEAEVAELEVRERLAELELMLEDEGWVRLGIAADREFSRTSLNRIIRVCRLMYLSNPLIRRAVDIQADYVWGQGVNIRGASDEVNEVVQAFLDDRQNAVELSSPAAKRQKEIDVRLTANVFLVLFTQPDTGMVRVRSFEAEECSDIVCNPEDVREPWYYLRQWTPLEFDAASGSTRTGNPKSTYYPDWLYRPASKPPKINGIPVQWDAPVYHIKVGALAGSRFGVPEIYPAIDWARAVKEDLEDYATIRKALSRFAWQLTTPAGPKGVAAARQKLNTTYGNSQDSSDTNPPPIAGSTFIRNEGSKLEPIKTSGMTPDPDEGRRIWLMVAAAVGIPEVMLSMDSTLGNYATARTLDRPTELKMRDRQQLWAQVYDDILGYVIDSAALAPKGPLLGRRVTDPWTGARRVEVVPRATPRPQLAKAEPLDRGLVIRFPEVLERDMSTRVQAIVTAATLNGQVPAGTIQQPKLTELLLGALLEKDIDDTLAEMDFPPEQEPELPGEPGEPGPLPTPPQPPAAEVPAVPEPAI